MKIVLLSLIILLSGSNILSADFDKYFESKTLRIDYYHFGHSEMDEVSLDHLYEYENWYGSTTNLIDKFDNGSYYIEIYDKKSKELIFSKGYDSYFREYKTSGPAAKKIVRTYHESAIIPKPKNEFEFVLKLMQKDNKSKLHV